uniref:Ig-like domain-containing protein n=1 Tax=Poecilia latipinna TaxID=48699 RepID=A0A3B3THH4_9TELE
MSSLPLDDECTPELQVRRNTTYKANLGEELRIECPVMFCNNLPPTICWYKVEKENICLNDNNTNHIKTEWKTSNLSKGIFYLLFQSIVISDSGEYQCKGGGTRSHIIYINMPLGERIIPNAIGIQHSPRGSPNPLPPRRPSGRKTTGQPAEPTPSRDNQPPHGQRTRDRNRNGAQAEEAGSVVYAALNHAPPQREAPRPQWQIEETEYAAIRLV